MRKQQNNVDEHQLIQRFMPGTVGFVGWSRFREQAAKGKKVIKWSGLRIIRIPHIEGRIYIDPGINNRRDLAPVKYIPEPYDPDEAKGNLGQEVIIGLSIPSVLEGWMITREEYDLYFDEDGNLIGQKDEAAEQDAEAETSVEAKETDENPEDEERAAWEREKEDGFEAKEEKTENAEEDRSDGRKGNGSSRNTKRKSTEEIEATLLEKEKILDRKIQSAEAERQKLLKLNEQAKAMIEGLKKSQAELDMIKEERLRSIDGRTKVRIEMAYSILQSQSKTIDELAKRKPYALMSLKQIRNINAIFESLRQYVIHTDAEDFLYFAEEPRMDDLENHPGTTYSEMSLLIDAYLNVFNLFQYKEIYEKDPEEWEEKKDGDKV